MTKKEKKTNYCTCEYTAEEVEIRVDEDTLQEDFYHKVCNKQVPPRKKTVKEKVLDELLSDSDHDEALFIQGLMKEIKINHPHILISQGGEERTEKKIRQLYDKHNKEQD